MLKRTVTWISTFSFLSPITNLVLVKGATPGTESLLLSEGPELAVARAEVGEERLFHHRAGLLWGSQALLPGWELALGLVFMAIVRILCAWIQCGVEVGF